LYFTGTSGRLCQIGRVLLDLSIQLLQFVFFVFDGLFIFFIEGLFLLACFLRVSLRGSNDSFLFGVYSFHIATQLGCRSSRCVFYIGDAAP